MCPSNPSKVIMPKNMDDLFKHVTETRENTQKKETWESFLERYWSIHKIDPDQLFCNIQFIGSIQSRKNMYFCYEYGALYLLSTGFKEITRPNIVMKEEVEELADFISDTRPLKAFSLSQLMDAMCGHTFSSERISEALALNRTETLRDDPLYLLVMNACYVLTALNRLSLDKVGRGVIFSKKVRKDQHADDTDIYAGIRYVGKIRDKTWLFENQKLYFTIQMNLFRGSIVPYIKEEIEYLQKFVTQYPVGERVIINDIVGDFDYSKRFQKIYTQIEYRNIRNDRDDRDFFVSRIKNSLEVVEYLAHSVKVKKEGRNRVFERI
ncbi:hypothetical protein Metli_2015 [Methanofollis liminatans DSM 4140]|uniref:Uncharacterized protein n=2 Tax=Methanofollis liminatans TaxID=2201 RepID=J1L4D3_9EURY|nr:hypothetical protein Metli_2015 [Methanofollis liminatans DSM 4140]